MRSSRGLATKWPKNACHSKPTSSATSATTTSTTTTTTTNKASDLSSTQTGPNGEETFELRPREIMTYAWQVAKGMNYLAGMKVYSQTRL